MRSRSAGESDRPAKGRLLTTEAPERNSTSPRAVAAGEEAVAGRAAEAGLAVEEAGLPGVPEGQVEAGPLVERAAALGPAPLEVGARDQPVAGRAPAAVGRQPDLAAQGHPVAAPRPELVAGPGLPG
jgi:hypothetical protein